MEDKELLGLWFSRNQAMWEIVKVKEDIVYLKKYGGRDIQTTSKKELLKYNRLNFELWGKEKCQV